ncbi:hypothetical protein BDZ45DRAFT_800298 [Acephala macrosclerotiorum]|nr:hypothetical protein BDZ45DRAFT_800298 [Acephala macrosclerotiorum]
MYFMKLDYQLKKAGGCSLDDLILEMVNLRRREEPYGIAIWLAMLEKELGVDALTDYHVMSDTVLINLSSDYLHVTEVRDLDPESRAAIAGVRSGDFIMPEYSFFSIAERWGRIFDMTVKRSSSASSEQPKL